MHEQRGFRVSPLGSEDIWDVINTRIFIETFALRDAIKRGIDQKLIVQSLDALRRADLRFQTSDVGDRCQLAGKLRRAHSNFHLSLIEATAFTRLYGAAKQLISETERYRAPLLALLCYESRPRSAWIGSLGRDIGIEHNDIADAVLAGDADKASRLLRAHYRQTAEKIASKVAPLDHGDA